MAVDFFLKLGNIKGESQDSKHKDEIDILSWSWGMTQSGSSQSSSKGVTAGRVSVNDISFTKHVDKATPNLLRFCCSGTAIPEATFVARKAGGKAPLEYLKVKLSQVIVSSVQSGGNNGDDRPVETFSLNFGHFELEYVPQKSDGSGEAAVPMQWNIQTNKEEKYSPG
jgi:type VI secretion system secreted protein Hcp